MRNLVTALTVALVLAIAEAALGAPGDTKKDDLRHLVRSCGAIPYTERELPPGQERLAQLGVPMLHIRTVFGPARLTLEGELATIDYEVLAFTDTSGHARGMTVAQLRAAGEALWRCDPVLARDLVGAKVVPGGFRGVLYLRGKRFGYVYNSSFGMAEVGSLAWFEFIRRTGE